MASIREPDTVDSAAPQWLLDAAMTRIHQGALPRELRSRVLAGSGRAQKCSLCDHTIEPGDVGYTVEAGQDGPLFFHVCCYRAWAKACSAMPRKSRASHGPAVRFDSQKRSDP